MNVIVLFVVFGLVAFGYLAYHRGFKEAAAVTAAFFAALYAAGATLFQAFH